MASFPSMSPTQNFIGNETMPFPTPYLTPGPTPEPTRSIVPAEVQAITMTVYIMIVLAIITIAYCMTKEWCCAHRCVVSTFGCGACKQCCAKKKKTAKASEGGVAKETDFLIRTFGWMMRPLPGSDPGSELYTMQFQLGLLLWKRFTEIKRAVGSTVLYFMLPSMGLLVITLLYASFASPAFSNAHSSGTIEIFASPMLFIVTVQLTTTSLVVEKSQRLREAMRMMGLREAPYWLSYIVVDAGILGFLLSFLMTVLSSVMGLYHNLGAGYSCYNHDDNDRDCPSQDFSGFLLLLYLSTLGMTTMAFALSSLFDTAQTAAMVAFATMLAGVVLFFIFLFSSPDLFDTASKQTLWCLFPPMALQIGILAKFTESGGLFAFVESSIPLNKVYGMLVLDAALYSFLAWYLGQILPSEIGVQRPPWFLLTPSFWAETIDSAAIASISEYWMNTGAHNNSSNSSNVNSNHIGAPLIQPLNSEDGLGVDEYEIVPLDEKGKTKSKKMTRAPLQLKCPHEPSLPGSEDQATVSVRGLTKSFGVQGFKAVDGLSFDMFEDEIFCLLGHNGAGKTTTINMLTGLFPPDRLQHNEIFTTTATTTTTASAAAASTTTVYGSDISCNMAGARSSLGVCPQHDVLFDALTAREHVAFFALLKGGSQTWAQAWAEADDLLKHFHLQERGLHMGSELSGGMKRKLSTAVAICGGSKFIVLDEPTAGMDPLARRELWDLLKGLRKGRTMLLTTHYMDEADVLGDRVGIMSRGQLQCLGSPSYLKRHFGEGYKLICTMRPGALTKGSRTNLQDLVDVAGEGGAGGGVAVASTDLETHPVVRQLLSFVCAHIPSAFFVAKESTVASLAFVLPFHQLPQFASFFEQFEENLQNLSVSGYGITITSLEEVFLKVGGDHDLTGEMASGQGTAGGTGGNTAGGTGGVVAVANPDDDENVKTIDADDGIDDGDDGGDGGGDLSFSEFKGQVAGLWRKRVVFARNDWLKSLPTMLLPSAAIATAFVLNLENVYGSSWKPGGLNSNLITSVICVAGFIPISALIVEHVVAERVLKLRNVLTVTGCDLKSYWLGNLAGDMTLVGVSVVVGTVAAACCASIKASNVLDDDRVLFRLDDDRPLESWVIDGRLPLALFLFSLQLISFCYFCSFWFSSPKLAIAFMPFFCIVLINGPAAFTGMGIYGLGRNGFGLIDPGQSGIVSAMLWFIAVVSPHGCLCMSLLRVGDVCRHVRPEKCVVPPYWASTLIMAAEACLYLFATYRIDRRNFLPVETSQNPANANLNNGVTGGISSAEVGGRGGDDDDDEDVALERDLVLGMAPEDIDVSLMLGSKHAFGIAEKNSGAQYRSLIGRQGEGEGERAVDAVTADATTEASATNPILKNCNEGEDVEEGSAANNFETTGSNGEEDVEHPYSLRIAGLRKLYAAKKVGQRPTAAVKNLNVRIPRGEVFGLLGANGAGKTTSISIVMRAAYPNCGEVHIEGHSVLKDFKRAARFLGVVTQHNTLWDRLSCEDHLRLFARLRGVPGKEIESLVQATCIELELGPYKHKLAMQLSGGMKRKLCVAVALIGDPKLVLLDEPSAGLDPVSRRNLWDTLIKTMQNRAVVLTTHSMEEAEALCTRIGIMVKGQLRALGSPQHLKQKFGSGYEIVVKMTALQEQEVAAGDNATDDTFASTLPQRSGHQGGLGPQIDKVAEYLRALFPSASVLSVNGGLVTFRIAPGEMHVGRAFAALERGKTSSSMSSSNGEQGGQVNSVSGGLGLYEDYAIAQPTLEQVFVRTVTAHSGGERRQPPSPGTTSSVLTTAANTTAVAMVDVCDDTDIKNPDVSSQQERQLQDDELALGIATEWCGMNRRSHCFLATAAGLFAYIGYNTIFIGRIGYVFLPFLMAFAASVVGCAGCCCCIPSDPEEDTAE